MLGRPVEQRQQAALGLLDREAEVARLGERDVHRRERDLDEVERAVVLEVPRPERVRDAGPEARRAAEAEARVVREAELGERREVRVRIDAEVVVALAVERRAEPLQLCLLLGDQRVVERGRVARVEADLGAEPEQRLDDARAQPVVRLGAGPSCTTRCAAMRKNTDDAPRAARARRCARS